METVTSSVRTKVKGDGFFPIDAKESLNKSDPDYYKKLFEFNPKFKYRMIDSGDYVIPPNEYNSLFIMTKFIKTEQVLDFCKRVSFDYFFKLIKDCWQIILVYSIFRHTTTLHPGVGQVGVERG